MRRRCRSLIFEHLMGPFMVIHKCKEIGWLGRRRACYQLTMIFPAVTSIIFVSSISSSHQRVMSSTAYRYIECTSASRTCRYLTRVDTSCPLIPVAASSLYISFSFNFKITSCLLPLRKAGEALLTGSPRNR